MEQSKFNHKFLKQLIRIRCVEQAFLDLFSKGKLNGTVHTCIGQEYSAVAFAGQLKKTDFIFSNHRCHGHYIAYTNEWKPLILELLGKKEGVCSGIGSSQHLQKFNFFSNGIQGGIMPIAAGFALGNKFIRCYREGKQLVLETSQGSVNVSLGMSGSFKPIHSSKLQEKHQH